MTVWFVVPAAEEAAFRAAFNALESGETVGVMVAEAGGARLFTGSSTITPEQALEVVNSLSGTEAHTQWPPPGGWQAIGEE